MNKNLGRKAIAICMAVLGVVLLISVVGGCARSDDRIFAMDREDIVSLTFAADVNGETKKLTVDERDRIDDILSKLNRLTYASVEKSGIRDGNSAQYRLTIVTGKGEESWNITFQTAKVTRMSYGTELTEYTYRLTPESVPIMEEIIALMPR